jgi:hypothetical protein
MLKKGLIIIGITATVLAASACSGPETLSQRNWGKSYETAAYNQMVNPDADKTQKVTGGMDGQAAMNTVKTYRDSFKAKQQNQKSYFINLK